MNYKIKYKIWFEKDGEIVMGHGREELLRKIDEVGSIKKAAEELGITYKKAWEYINAMEKRLGVKLLETQRGGAKGGGSKLTEEARKILEDFKKVENEFEKLKNKLEKNG